MISTALQSRGFSAKNALRDAVMALQHAHIETASLDARLLLQHVLGVSREQLLSDDKQTLNLRQQAVYLDLVEKRAGRKPVSQLVGKREFWGRTFKVTEATLDPRPDSETLIEAVLGKFRDRDATLALLDLGTGTGCLLLTLLEEYSNARGIGVDISNEALAVAQDNAKGLGVESRVSFVQSCWGEKVEGLFDIIVSNPPYIPTRTIPMLAPEVYKYEPIGALDGGEDGLDCYRAIIAQLPKLLAKDGLAVFEIGMGQHKDVGAIATANGLRVAGIKEDMAGIPRCVMVTH